MSRWIPAYVGVGSNLEDPRSQVRSALQALEQMPQTCCVVRSRLYRTKPFGPVPQEDFINAAAGLLTTLPAEELLAGLRAMENARGRVRAERWGPRILDMDLLVYGAERIATETLTVPHPGIVERGFVLAPLADIAPSLMVPGMGAVGELLRALPETGIAEVLAA